MQKEIKRKATAYGLAAALLSLVLGTLCYHFGAINLVPFPQPAHASLLNTFSSYEELKNFLSTKSTNQGTAPFLSPLDISLLGVPIETFGTTPKSLRVYSTTNIQVEGVDEADIVKTDGEYIYIIRGTGLVILKAYPPDEAEIVSRISFLNENPVGLFIDNEGNRLAVLTCQYMIKNFYFPWSFYECVFVNIKTCIHVLDVSNKTNIISLGDYAVSGSYFDSRMIGDYVYFVVSQPAYEIYDTVILPKIYFKGNMKEISPKEIYYTNSSDDYYMYTTIVAYNVKNTTQEPTHITVLLGGTSTMYVSLNNIYLTFPETIGETTIYRIHLENSTFSIEAKGTVKGRELNQFSMDEYNGHFRIATATTSWSNGTPKNNLYILNMNLSLVGTLEDFAPPGEVMDSARFIENRCYLSTSTPRKDPFFVIDLEDPEHPKILGDLSIPGFTKYLHPYDENHIIGVGSDSGNVKIMLFDVTNVSAPINISEYKVNGIWSDTPVLREHKAFLFDKPKCLLAFPLSITYTDKYWQGVYVFNITSSAITLRGNITHLDNGNNYWDQDYWIKRVLYIEDVLYTISESKLKLNNIEELAFIKEIELY